MASEKKNKRVSFSSAKNKWDRSRKAAVLALAVILFGAGNAWAQDDGYIIKNGDETIKYESLFTSNPQNGDYIGVIGGNVAGGGAVEHNASSTISLQGDDSDQKIDANNADRLFYSNQKEFELTLNVTNLELTNGNAGEGNSGGLIITQNGNTVTINGKNAAFTNSRASRGGVIYSGTVNINGSNTFTNNSANNSFNIQGGAICASNQIVFEGKGSTAIFSGNTVNVDSTVYANDVYANNNITIKDGGRYVFGGGITTPKPDDHQFQTFTIQDNSNVTFGTGSSTEINGTTLLNSAILTVQGGKNTALNVGALEVMDDSRNTIIFEHKYSETGTVMSGTTLTTLEDTPIFAKVANAEENQFVYVSGMTNTTITTSAETGTAAFNLVHDKGFLGSSTTLDGTYGTGSAKIQSGDTIIVTTNGNTNVILPTLNEDISLTIQSNTNEVREITADAKKILSTNDKQITLNLNQIKFVGNDSSNIGALIDSKVVVINGSGEFGNNNSSGVNGGAISASDTAEINGTIQFIGEKTQTGLVFTNNTATNGGAISGNTVKISGSDLYEYKGIQTYANTFTGNQVSGGNGGAVYASSRVNLSGSNLFNKNKSGSDGGAIYSDGTVSVSGDNTFTGNTASSNDGGAIWAKSDITFSGKDSTTTFSGNTAKGSNNDMFSKEGNITFNGGTHILGGGMVANGTDDDVNTGIINVTGGANVYLEDGTLSSARNLVIDQNATLTIDLNVKNKVSALNKTDITDGATKLFLTGTGSINEGGMNVYLERTTGMTNGYYLVASGDFSGNDTNNVVYNNWDYASCCLSATTAGLYLGVLLDPGTVSRTNTEGLVQNIANTFDAALDDGLGAMASGDTISLSAHVDSEKVVVLNNDVNVLTIQSDDLTQQRIITGTGTPGHRFLKFDGDATVNTKSITFQNGGNHEVFGGAIASVGDLTVNGNTQDGGKATEFKNNQAEFGGALGAYSGISENHSDVTLGGNLVFDDNNASLHGGAVYATGTTTLNGDSTLFENNTANGNGGAVSTRDWVISGTDNSFKNNHADVYGGAVYANGNVIFTEGSKTDFSGNTMGTGDDETSNDLFVAPNLGDSSIITIERNATVNFQGGIIGKDNTSLVIEQGAHVTFNDGAILNIGGDVQINSDDVTLGDNVGMNFQHGLVVGADISQELKGNVSIAGMMGVTFDPNDNSISCIDLRDTSSISISDQTAVKIYNQNGGEMTAKDFRGVTPQSGNRWTLVYGKSDALNNITSEDTYESLLYRVNIGRDGQNFVVTSEKKDLEFETIEGNAEAAAKLFGLDIYDVQTIGEARDHVNALTGELYASNATAQVQRLGYLHKMIVGHVVDDALPQYEGSICSSSIMRGQHANGACACNNQSAQFWSSGYGIGGYTHLANQFNGYDYQASGMMIGVDWNRDTTQLGLFYGYGQTNIDAVQSSLNGKDHIFGGLAKWNSLLFGGYTTALGTFSFSDNDGKRWYAGQSFAEDFSSWQGATYLEKGWKYINPFGVNVNPYVVLQYIGYSADATENEDIQIGDVNYDSLRTITGCRFDRDFCLNGNLLNLSTGMAWHHELLDSNASFIATANLGNALASAEIFGINSGRDWFEYTAGVDIALSENMTFSGDYYLFLNGHSALNAGMGTVTWRF